MDNLAGQFSQHIPDKTFTTAELQGFLLTCKFQPEKAVREVKDWVDNTVKEKLELEEKKKAKQEKVQEMRDKEEVEKLRKTLNKMNGLAGSQSERVDESGGENGERDGEKRTTERPVLQEVDSDMRTTTTEPDTHR
jgi:chaperone BCS1